MSKQQGANTNAERVAEWRARNPGKHAANQRAYRKRRRGLIDAYEDVIAAQDEEIAALKAKVRKLRKRLAAS